MLDANILISGIAFSAGLQSRIIDRRGAGAFDLLASRQLVDEVTRALVRSEFARRTEDGYRAKISVVLDGVEWIAVDEVKAGLATHPEDDVIVATAVLGDADVLVTGDKQLLKLGRVEGVRIVDSRTFLEMLDDED
ncbi:MAG: putative toxin-antitoxin system toxin component, PIN family [Rhizobiales bacterium]|nr:putative toxin-antitoxin system toxin component, PIN family [Hyphomicrobiales bacterium]